MPIKIELDGLVSVPEFRLKRILKSILDERPYQDKTWGTEFDDKNTLNDWVSYANTYMGDAARMEATPEEQQKGVLKAASLLVAALEAFDRNEGFAPRHYDPEKGKNMTKPADPSRTRTLEK